MKNIIAKIRNPKFFRPAIGVIIGFILIGIIFYFEKTNNKISIENSLIDAPIVSIAPTTPGKLIETDVYEGERVERGDTLAIVGTETLKSSTDGLVVMADKQIGGTAGVTTPIVQLINPLDVRVAGTLDENKGLDMIRVGQVASFTVDALPGKTFWGYVDEISPTAKSTQLSFSISSERPTQQFIIYARFNATAYPEIKNGMSAKMTVYTSTQ